MKKICLIVLAAVVAFVVSWVLWPSDDGGRDGALSVKMKSVQVGEGPDVMSGGRS